VELIKLRNDQPLDMWVLICRQLALHHKVGREPLSLDVTFDVYR
jgi:hypothetical protein